tara:strand:+ start:262 stop:972 length:711 start_codon:yes stop_codon:yes gene_type:complete
MHTLLFHSFSQERHVDPFYDIDFYQYVELLTEIKRKISCNHEISIDDGFQSSYNAIKFAHKLGFKTSLFIITDNISRNGFLSKEEIKELSDMGCLIGSHTKTHTDLTTISLENVEYELMESQNILSNITGKKIEYLSIPYGNYNQNVIKISLRVFKSISISRPNYIFDNSYLKGRFPIHRKNIMNKNQIMHFLNGNTPYFHLIRYQLLDFIKRLIVPSFYRKMKSVITSFRTIDIK